MSSKALGGVSILIGWFVMALILYFLFVPYSSKLMFMPTTIIGVGSLVATLCVVIGLTTGHQSP